MANGNNKQRILALREIFLRKTDEDNQLSVNQIIKELKKVFGEDFVASYQSIKNDIDNLNENGICIIEDIGKNNEKFYSHQNKKFELYELRMIIDAVCSARFITRQESERLISKPKELTSDGMARKLQNEIYLDNRVKANNPQVKIFIDQIHQAISKQNKVCFQYGRYNVNKEFILNREGAIYKVKPYGLVWNHDFYYLIGKKDGENDFKHYRVDRMQRVQIIEEQFKKE